ncbi:maleylpyruvate isomerase N-terminal domain-containing protein [Nocardioides sp. BP30]|uniref:maleylpyruvate isomerase N-terminal domain-containing protein n=1 Tax=Nocardioides sp. BP30 TaxID=3036374 RepID=UPI002468CCC4|nr:maleylpyruvate isomerase N-terminal domain-containing protein [Nocardioides sp. BP30]WGL52636.1 maleylpyruvate isomerase N-terminal domain-containing protein [Nocardioides sp. BP30]
MPTELSVAEHLEGLREAMIAFVRYADRAGLAADVPTCPGWTVRDLVAHQGMVHRWATDRLQGARVADPERWLAEGAAEADPLEWLRDGVVELAQAFTRVPDDVEAPVFLEDAPAPRAFWARRQCHETTIHAVDAQTAALGRPPRAEETQIPLALALDGLDELVMGNVPRSKYRLRSSRPTSLAVAPGDAGVWWLMRVGPDPVVSSRHTGPIAADHVLEGTATELYLRLWNRAADTATPLGDWRELVAVV